MESYLTKPLTPMHEAILLAWRSAFGDEKIIYISGPIRTGWREVLRLRNGGDVGAIRAENVRELMEVAEKVRQNSLVVPRVIAPGPLFIKEWEPPDYMDLWNTVIATMTSHMVLLSRWQFSVGASMEFLQAQRFGVPCNRFRGDVLTTASGYQAINIAVAEVRSGHTGNIPQMKAMGDALELVAEQLRALMDERTPL